MNGKSIITQLAEKYLNADGQEDIKERLRRGKLHSAKIYLLGAIDSLWRNKKIDEKEAAEAYRLLDTSTETASKIRQNSRLWD
jgi:hypothetical protein